MREVRDERREVDCLIVPGYTPRVGWRAGLHPTAAARCRAAGRDLAGGVAPLVIVSGGAVHSEENEALLMRDALVDLGAPPDRIWIEPCARHTTTNLRNAGRIMLALGLHVAYVVTFLAQAYYLGAPHLSTFHVRCRMAFGFTVGKLAWVRPGHVRFLPAAACLGESPRPSREGDP